MDANVVFCCTAADTEKDGALMRFAPQTAAEYGFQIPVLVTSAAYAETIEWTRPGDGDGDACLIISLLEED